LITVFEYNNYLRPKQVLREYSCPYCYKAIKWEKDEEASPIICPGCRERLIDISKILSNINWKMLYHFEEPG